MLKTADFIYELPLSPETTNQKPNQN